MKLHKPLFSIVVISAQLIFSLINYYQFKAWLKTNPELDELISTTSPEGFMLLFVSIIGIYEMLIKPGLLKTTIRFF